MSGPVLTFGDILQTALGLLSVLAVILLGAWVLKRFTGIRGEGEALKVVGVMALGSRERLVLVEVEGKRLLLGVSPGRVETLHVFEP